jgi:hypothetical protein
MAAMPNGYICRTMPTEKRTIGRIDLIDLPEYAMTGLTCKVDTGADTSSLHCSRIRVVEDKDGREVLEFRVLDPKHPLYNGHSIRTREFSDRSVRSSSGHVEVRYTIATTLVLFGREWPVEFTLTDRGQMRYPVLLGRRFLKKGFVVDVTRTNLSAKQRPRP